MSGHKRTRFCPDMIVTTRFGYNRVWAQTCLGTNVCGHNRVWAQSCLGTNVRGHNRVWAQSCVGTIVCGHNHVWAQSCVGTIMCGHNHVWAQSCLGTIVSGHKRVWAQSCVGTIMCGHNRVWAQTCLGTIVCGHNHVWAQSCVGTIMCGHNHVWAQSCLGTIVSGHNRVWAQSCLGTIVCGHNRLWAQSCGLNRVGSIMYGPNRVVSAVDTKECLNGLEDSFSLFDDILLHDMRKNIFYLYFEGALFLFIFKSCWIYGQMLHATRKAGTAVWNYKLFPFYWNCEASSPIFRTISFLFCSNKFLMTLREVCSQWFNKT